MIFICSYHFNFNKKTIGNQQNTRLIFETCNRLKHLTLSRRRPLSCRNQSMIWRANQWTGFYMITASVLKGLKRKCFSVLRQKQSCSHGVKDGCKNLQLLVLYYVSIISDRFLVRSKTIHHILQPNGNRNLVGSIRHVSYFHLERYDKMIKIVHYVIHINFLIKSTDSC